MKSASTRRCESCGMPVQTARYCPYCTDASGGLQTFETRLAQMIGQALTERPQLSYEAAERGAREQMASMPAWRNHPRIVGRRSRHLDLAETGPIRL